jgi:hypothetical protein
MQESWYRVRRSIPGSAGRRRESYTYLNRQHVSPCSQTLFSRGAASTTVHVLCTCTLTMDLLVSTLLPCVWWTQYPRYS